jgi:hypothetical protein
MTLNYPIGDPFINVNTTIANKMRIKNAITIKTITMALIALNKGDFFLLPFGAQLRIAENKKAEKRDEGHKEAGETNEYIRSIFTSAIYK